MTCYLNLLPAPVIVDNVVEHNFSNVLEDVFNFEHLYELVRKNHQYLSFDFMTMITLSYLSNEFRFSSLCEENRKALKTLCMEKNSVPFELRRAYKH